MTARCLYVVVYSYKSEYVEDVATAQYVSCATERLSTSH